MCLIAMVLFHRKETVGLQYLRIPFDLALGKFSHRRFVMTAKTFKRMNLIFLKSYNIFFYTVLLLFFFLLFRQRVYKTSANSCILLFLLILVIFNIHPSVCSLIYYYPVLFKIILGANLILKIAF